MLLDDLHRETSVILSYSKEGLCANIPCKGTDVCGNRIAVCKLHNLLLGSASAVTCSHFCIPTWSLYHRNKYCVVGTQAQAWMVMSFIYKHIECPECGSKTQIKYNTKIIRCFKCSDFIIDF